MNVEQLMHGIPRNTPAVIIIQNDAGLCAVLDTREPHRNLMHIASTYTIERREALATHCHQEIAWQLREWLTSKHAGMPWAMVDFEDLKAQLAMFDPMTGKRRSLGGINVGDRVATADLGRGKVVAIRPDGRFQINLDNPKGTLYSVLAPRSLIKPVLRPVTP
jgi:hypothetical protein